MSILAFLCYVLSLIALSCAVSQTPCGLCPLASIGLLLACSIHVAVNTRAKIKGQKRERQSNSLRLCQSL